ncbi:MAG: hypothetical protein HOB26_09795 [Flavobacteriales bacterium]|nr:hypothetical protein [Flavobacteriales bacterium]
MVILGLGKAGSNIAKLFKVDDNYKVFTYDGGDNVPVCISSEEYESRFTKKKELSRIKNKTVWLFVCGAGKIAGSTLRLLEQVKNNKINVVYIVPDLSILPDQAKKRHRACSGVLQEYARSGLLNAIYFVSNESMINIVGESPLTSYYDKMNELLFNCIHSINVFANTDPIFGGTHEPKGISRIRTFAFREVEKEQKKLFFPLDNITETCYIYSINETELNRNTNLISEIKGTMNKDIISSFSIYPSSHEYSYAYGIYYTHFTQEV